MSLSNHWDVTLTRYVKTNTFLVFFLELFAHKKKDSNEKTYELKGFNYHVLVNRYAINLGPFGNE